MSRPSRVPMMRNHADFLSSSKFELQNLTFSHRDSITSNASSFAHDTVATEMGEFDNDSRIIYEVVEDLIKVTQAQDLIRSNKVYAKTNNFITPERQQRRGLDIDQTNIKILPFNSPNSPFAYFNNESAAKPLSLQECHRETDKTIKQIFNYTTSDSLFSIDDDLIEYIHHNCKKELNNIVSKITASNMQETDESDSLVQRLNNIKKQFVNSRTSTHGLLYAMNILNLSLVYLINHITEKFEAEKTRLLQQITTLIHSDFYNKEYVLKYKDRTIHQIREEANAKERELIVTKKYEKSAMVLQKLWRRKQSKCFYKLILNDFYRSED
jgi:hypothetical protein